MIFTYEKILEIAREILDNEDIPKENLTLVYKLPAHQHKKLNEHIFYSQHKDDLNVIFEPSDVFEVDIADIIFRFEVIPVIAEVAAEV